MDCSNAIEKTPGSHDPNLLNPLSLNRANYGISLPRGLGAATRLMSMCAIFKRVAADDSPPCYANVDIGPVNSFRFSAWLNLARCIRNTPSYDTCTNRLSNVLTSPNSPIDALHGLEYQASASVMALVPTIGTLFGSPNTEVWALGEAFPPAGVFALSLSFGGSLLPVGVDQYMAVMIKQGLQALNLDTQSLQTELQRAGDNFPWQTMPAHDELTAIRRKLVNTDPNILLTVACSLFFLLFAADMAAMALVEDGSIFSTWCNSDLWLHSCYFLVTASVVLDAWIAMPFYQRWKVYMTEDLNVSEPPASNNPNNGHLSADHHDIDWLLENSDKAKFREHLASIKKDRTVVGVRQITNTLNQAPRQMLFVISVITDDKPIPEWVSLMRLISKAVGLGVFVYGTTIFASVTLLALPMAQMMVGLILGTGLLGRALTGGLLAIVTKRTPITHVLVDSDATADEVLKHVLRRGSSASSGSMPLVSEVNGAVFIGRRCVGQRSRLVRGFLGIYAPAFRFLKGDSGTNGNNGKV